VSNLQKAHTGPVAHTVTPIRVSDSHTRLLKHILMHARAYDSHTQTLPKPLPTSHPMQIHTVQTLMNTRGWSRVFMHTHRHAFIYTRPTHPHTAATHCHTYKDLRGLRSACPSTSFHTCARAHTHTYFSLSGSQLCIQGVSSPAEVQEGHRARAPQARAQARSL
jgi:hypothetical protein